MNLVIRPYWLFSEFTGIRPIWLKDEFNVLRLKLKGEFIVTKLKKMTLIIKWLFNEFIGTKWFKNRFQTNKRNFSGETILCNIFLYKILILRRNHTHPQ